MLVGLPVLVGVRDGRAGARSVELHQLVEHELLAAILGNVAQALRRIADDEGDERGVVTDRPPASRPEHFVYTNRPGDLTGCALQPTGVFS